jgi:hypothetical protein
MTTVGRGESITSKKFQAAALGQWPAIASQALNKKTNPDGIIVDAAPQTRWKSFAPRAGKGEIAD